jgi:hypothetical protein
VPAGRALLDVLAILAAAVPVVPLFGCGGRCSARMGADSAVTRDFPPFLPHIYPPGPPPAGGGRRSSTRILLRFLPFPRILTPQR